MLAVVLLCLLAGCSRTEGRAAVNKDHRKDQEAAAADQQHHRKDQETTAAFQRPEGVIEAPVGDIAFVSDGQIWTVDTDGSNLRRLTDFFWATDTYVGGFDDLDWSRDLKKIAFTDDGCLDPTPEPPPDLSGSASSAPLPRPCMYIMNADGSDLVRLPVPDEISSVQQPALSPDGKEVAFSGGGGGVCSIYATNSDGSGEPRSLTVQPTAISNAPRFTARQGCDTNPAWSPDGEEVAFQSNRVRGIDNLYVVNATGEEGDANRVRQLTDSPEPDGNPTWSPDGTEIAFTRYMDDADQVSGGEADIYKVDADGSEMARLTYGKGIEGVPGWSPDGRQIVLFRTDYPGAPPNSTAIYRMDRDGTDPVLVTNVEGKQAYQPTWVVTAAFGGDNTGQVTSDQDTDDESAREASEDWRAVDASPLDRKLQAYIDETNALRSQGNLPVSAEGVGDPRTLQVLEELDATGKEKVVRFLAKAGLVQGVDGSRPIISLSHAELEGANLYHADLRGAELSAAALDGADLREANLSGADLYEAYLSKTEMNGANLSGADLTGVQAPDADLRGADLTDANLFAADLTRADLRGAELQGADRREAVLRGTKITLSDEEKARVRAWEAEARGELKNLYATLKTCLATTEVEKWDPHVTPETIQDVRITRCTELSSGPGPYAKVMRPNVGFSMYEQTRRVGAISEGTGEVVITVQHSFGGSAFQTSTATDGRIQRIGREYPEDYSR